MVARRPVVGVVRGNGQRTGDGWKLLLLLAVPRGFGLGGGLGRRITAAADRDGDVLHLQAEGARGRRPRSMYTRWEL